jgi:hypothetical protein
MADNIFSENLLNQLRAQNIFSPEEELVFPSLPDSSLRSEPQVEDYDVNKRMSELYQPQNEAVRRFNESIGMMPQRGEPGLERRIVSGLMSIRSPERAARYRHQPFYDELEDWKTRMEPLHQAAQLENQFNTNMRAIASSIVSQEMADRRLEQLTRHQTETERQGQARVAQGEERLEQANERIKISQALARGGEFRIDKFGDPYIWFKDGSTINIDKKHMTAEELARLRQQYPSGAASRDRIREVVIDDPDNPGQKIAATLNLDTNTITRATIATDASKEVKPGTQTVIPRTKTSEATDELAEQRRILNNARKVKNSNPQWSKWITIKGNDVSITPKSMLGLRGPDDKTFKEISMAIYGTPEPPAAPAAPAGNTRRVIGPNGQTGTVPSTTTTLPQGWRFQ